MMHQIVFAVYIAALQPGCELQAPLQSSNPYWYGSAPSCTAAPTGLAHPAKPKIYTFGAVETKKHWLS